jgi:hypothetical protein
MTGCQLKACWHEKFIVFLLTKISDDTSLAMSLEPSLPHHFKQKNPRRDRYIQTSDGSVHRNI